MPLDGVVHFDATVNKTRVTTDDVTVLVLKNGTPVISQVIPAATVSSAIPVSGDITVAAPVTSGTTVTSDKLEVKLAIDSPIDVQALSWTPGSTTRARRAAASQCPPPTTHRAADARACRAGEHRHLPLEHADGARGTVDLRPRPGGESGRAHLSVGASRRRLGDCHREAAGNADRQERPFPRRRGCAHGGGREHTRGDGEWVHLAISVPCCFTVRKTAIAASRCRGRRGRVRGVVSMFAGTASSSVGCPLVGASAGRRWTALCDSAPDQWRSPASLPICARVRVGLARDRCTVDWPGKPV